MLVVIGSRMGPGVRRGHTPEDVWQETLTQLWRDRKQFEWRGQRAFRALVLTMIDNRIRDLADRAGAIKRGHEHEITGDTPPGVRSTTPGGIAIAREQAIAMRDAMAELPADLRDLIHLRLFEQRPIEDIAAAMGISRATGYRRFREGVEIYRRALRRQLASRSETISKLESKVGPFPHRVPLDHG